MNHDSTGVRMEFPTILIEKLNELFRQDNPRGLTMVGWDVDKFSLFYNTTGKTINLESSKTVIDRYINTPKTVITIKISNADYEAIANESFSIGVKVYNYIRTILILHIDKLLNLEIVSDAVEPPIVDKKHLYEISITGQANDLLDKVIKDNKELSIKSAILSAINDLISDKIKYRMTDIVFSKHELDAKISRRFHLSLPQDTMYNLEEMLERLNSTFEYNTLSMGKLISYAIIRKFSKSKVLMKVVNPSRVINDELNHHEIAISRSVYNLLLMHTNKESFKGEVDSIIHNYLTSVDSSCIISYIPSRAVYEARSKNKTVSISHACYKKLKTFVNNTDYEISDYLNGLIIYALKVSKNT